MLGSLLCLAGLGATALFLQGRTPEDVARFAAWGVLGSLAVSVAMDLRRGVHNVVRADLMALMSLYFLTLTEFLVPQGQFNNLAGMDSTRTAVLACILAYAGMVAGRHLVPPTRKHRFQALFQQPVPSSVLFMIFWACVIIGYLNMLIAVKFNFAELIDYFMQPRFAQPWQRGRLGDWKAMLYEMSMILYLVPPLGPGLPGDAGSAVHVVLWVLQRHEESLCLLPGHIPDRLRLCLQPAANEGNCRYHCRCGRGAVGVNQGDARFPGCGTQGLHPEGLLHGSVAYPGGAIAGRGQ
jgi:hypothetical protein